MNPDHWTMYHLFDPFIHPTDEKNIQHHEECKCSMVLQQQNGNDRPNDQHADGIPNIRQQGCQNHAGGCLIVNDRGSEGVIKGKAQGEKAQDTD
ncbi:hypothetical protein GCM10008957_11460 [Deinococcus ruber]|uniref:Uncharacterized protein n=1 Tax=Deinococcus ruber TaxID=1848197 RepID=A0A918C144_9DEIO|nr:hypothetical protein GCM10008957_11460 [Deinococcus ruber]